MLAARKVTVNGAVAIVGAQSITPFDRVEANGKVLQVRTPRSIALHKPVGVVSATKDSENTTVVDLIREPWAGELHLAGRLDRYTSGLVVLTNDSRFSEALTLPERKVPKTYLVRTDLEISREAISAIERGILFEKEKTTTHPAIIDILEPISLSTNHL